MSEYPSIHRHIRDLEARVLDLEGVVAETRDRLPMLDAVVTEHGQLIAWQAEAVEAFKRWNRCLELVPSARLGLALLGSDCIYAYIDHLQPRRRLSSLLTLAARSRFSSRSLLTGRCGHDRDEAQAAAQDPQAARSHPAPERRSGPSRCPPEEAGFVMATRLSSRLMQAVHLLLFVPRVPPPGVCGTAVALPAATPGCGLMSGGRSLDPLRRFELAVMPELVSRGVPELVHGGSDDMAVWPPSLPERQLAGEWNASGDPSVAADLYRLAGSEDRACAIAELVYVEDRAALADVLLARAFGRDITEVSAR
jgi:hypothetical protein